eukprot:4210469-Amphidinium_carterae.1
MQYLLRKVICLDVATIWLLHGVVSRVVRPPLGNAAALGVKPSSLRTVLAAALCAPHRLDAQPNVTKRPCASFLHRDTAQHFQNCSDMKTASNGTMEKSRNQK